MLDDAALSSMLDTALDTFKSAFDALSRIDAGSSPLEDRQYITDSFLANRLSKAFKDWEENRKRTYLEKEARAYNRQVGQLAMVNTKVEALEAEHQRISGKNTLPDFVFSINAIEKYDNGSLLQHIKQDPDGMYPRQVHTREIFLLQENSPLPEPDFAMFSRLVNIEATIRIEKKIVCEVLTHAKNQLASRNRKWSARDSSLQQFLEKTLPEMFAEIDKVREEMGADEKRDKDWDMELETENEQEKEEEGANGDGNDAEAAKMDIAE